MELLYNIRMYYNETAAARVAAGLEALQEKPIWLPEATDVQFYFTGHNSGEDLGDYDRIHGYIQASDILLKELVVWDDNNPLAKDFNKVSRGDEKAYDRLRVGAMNNGDTYMPKLLRAVRGTGTVVTSVDVGARNPLLTSVHRLMHIEDKVEKQARRPISHDPDQSVRHTLSIINDFAIAQKYRERYMLSQLGPKLGQVISDNPKLARKNEIKVIFEVGASHTSLFHTLRRHVDNEHVSRTFSEKPVWAELNQVLRAKLMGLEIQPKVERELVLRGYMTETVIALGDETGVLSDVSLIEKSRLGRLVSRNYGVEQLEQFIVLNALEQPEKVNALHQELTQQLNVVVDKNKQLG